MDNIINNINGGDPSITPQEIKSFNKVANKVLDMIQPGLTLQPGLKYSVGATSTQKPDFEASFDGKMASEVKQEFVYGGSFASSQPAASTSNEHYAALANMPIIKE
jgi:hypothetical protein